MATALSLPRVIGIVIGGLAGFLLVRSLAGYLTAPDPLAQVVPTLVYTELEEGAPIDPRLGGKIPSMRKGETFKVGYWKQEVYGGQLSEASVATICAAGKAHALEARLQAWAKAALRETLVETNETLRDLSLIISDEEASVKRSLASRKDRCFVLRTRPETSDPLFGAYMRQAKATGRGKGAVWSGGTEGGGVTHYVVLWKEWPRLRRLLGQRMAVLHEREREVGAWIQAEYEKQGMRLLLEH
ncbi:MAG: hypothetical protein ACE5F1_17130 [Planctomycetota bacterium]